MKYLAGVLFLASCAMLTPVALEEDRRIEQPVPAESPGANPEQPTSRPETRKPKLKVESSPQPPPEVSACANLDAGDLKETIKAKLDCITENTK